MPNKEFLEVYPLYRKFELELPARPIVSGPAIHKIADVPDKSLQRPKDAMSRIGRSDNSRAGQRRHHQMKETPFDRNETDSAGGEIRQMSQVRMLQRGERIADIIEEAKVRTFQTGNEHALVKLATGDRALVSGGPGGIDFAPNQIARLFGHTHPYHVPPTGPSASDIAVLESLGQQSSYLLEHGQLIQFRRK